MDSPATAPTATITFAIPFYRGDEYLRRAIRSVFAQTSPAWQLVVCDDSPDGAAEAVLAEFADPRVRYARNPRNLGMAGNWNRCFDVTETELVTLLHGDDELLPNYAATMTRAAAAHRTAAALFCRARVIGADSQPVFSFPDRIKDVLLRWGTEPVMLSGPEGIAGLLRGNYIMCPTVCYRLPVVGDRRFQARWKFVLDLEFFSRLLKDGGEIVGVPEFAYAYRRHAENATAAYTESLLRFEEEAKLYDELARDASARGWHSVARVGGQKRMIRLHLAFRIVSDALRGRFRAAANKFNFLLRLNCPRAVCRRSPPRTPAECHHA